MILSKDKFLKFHFLLKKIEEKKK